MAKKTCRSGNAVLIDEMIDFMKRNAWTCQHCKGEGWIFDFEGISPPYPCERCEGSGIMVRLPRKERPRY